MRKYKKGFTLVELMISVAILGVIVAITYDVINSSNIFFSRQNSNIKNNEDIRVINTWLTKDLQSSSSFIDNSLSDDAKKGKSPIYEIGDIKYYRINTGKINDDNLYRIERHSNKDGKIVLVENVSEDGFTISFDKFNGLYEVTVILKDKFNSDKKNKFIVSAMKDVVITKPEIPDDNGGDTGEIGNPFIDKNGNEEFDQGEDYRIAFDSNNVYNTYTDKRYTNPSWKLVFEKDFSKSCAIIAQAGIVLKNNVDISPKPGNGDLYINAPNITFRAGSRFYVNGNSSISLLKEFPTSIKVAAETNMAVNFVMYNPTLSLNGNNSSINIIGAAVHMTPINPPNPFPPADNDNTENKNRIVKIESNTGDVNIESASLSINYGVFWLKNKNNSKVNLKVGTADINTVVVKGRGGVFLNGQKVK